MVDTMRDARRSCTLSCSHWTGQNEDQDLQSGSVDGQGRGQAWGWRWGLGGIQRRRSLGWAARWEQDFDCCRRKPLDLTKETWTESLGLAGRIGTRGSVAAYKETFKGDSFNRFGALCYQTIFFLLSPRLHSNAGSRAWGARLALVQVPNIVAMTHFRPRGGVGF